MDVITSGDPRVIAAALLQVLLASAKPSPTAADAKTWAEFSSAFILEMEAKLKYSD